MKYLILNINDVGDLIARFDKILKGYAEETPSNLSNFMVRQYMNHRADLIVNLHKIMTESGLDLRVWLPEISFLLAEKATEIDPEKTRRRFEEFIRKMEAAMQESSKAEFAWAA